MKVVGAEGNIVREYRKIGTEDTSEIIKEIEREGGME